MNYEVRRLGEITDMSANMKKTGLTAQSLHHHLISMNYFLFITYIFPSGKKVTVLYS